jgi:hypothetical protein
MNEFPNQSTTNMSTYYSSTKTPPLTTQQLTDHDNKNGTNKDALALQVIQHWKSKTLNHQASSHTHFSSKHMPNITTTSYLSNEIPSNETDKNSNKDDLSINTDKTEKMKQRVKPIPASYLRRRPNLQNDFSNPQLLTPHNKIKPSGTTTKKPKSSSTIFIAPKKNPSPPLSFSTRSYDDSLQIKRKPILEKQTTVPDDQNSLLMINWAPAPPTSPGRSFVSKSNNSPDEDSSDDSDNESLLIRKKVCTKKKHQQSHPLFPTCSNIPSAIFITDPYGQSHTFDPSSDLQTQFNHTEQRSDENSDSIDTSALGPNSTFDISSPPDIEIIPPASPVMHDKHILDIIGEEEEDNPDDKNIFSKQLDQIKTSSRSRQTNLNVQNNNTNQIEPKPLSRRWSDGTDDGEKEKNSSTHASLIKTASTASIIKPTETLPPKVSKTKYLLMKLHLTSSSKDDESTISSTTPPKKRTVHRSMDKKRYQTQ